MVKKRLGFLIFSLVFIFCSCYFHEVETTMNPEVGKYYRTSPDSVIIYDAGFTPSWEFEIIARIEIASQGTDWATAFSNAFSNKNDPLQPVKVPREVVYKKLKKEAAKLGADAVIITDHEVNITEFNKTSRTQGSAYAWGNSVYYSSTTSTTVDRSRTDIRYSYAIKKIG